jgi:AraC family transcriptional regulator of adaptative response/methylated-DNA-[protein]-cysteine methyltransferase
MTPGDYRNGGRFVMIRYTIVGSTLGRLLLAGTRKGACAVYLGDEDAALVTELRREFPAAALERDEPGLAEWAACVVGQVAGSEPSAELPLDVRATAFQRRVWEELCKVPRGQTRTYTQIAEALGRPTATRAVARACATNPVSIVVPCHRILRRDGSLGGYRWGLHRKKELLRREREATPPPNPLP